MKTRKRFSANTGFGRGVLTVLLTAASLQALDIRGKWFYLQRNVGGTESRGRWEMTGAGTSVAGYFFPSNDETLQILGTNAGNQIEFVAKYLDGAKQDISGAYRFEVLEDGQVLSGYSRSNGGDMGTIVAIRDSTVMGSWNDQAGGWTFREGPGWDSLFSWVYVSPGPGAKVTAAGRIDSASKWIQGALGYGLRCGGRSAVSIESEKNTRDTLTGLKTFTWEAWVRPLSSGTTGSVLRFDPAAGEPVYALDLGPGGDWGFEITWADGSRDILKAARKWSAGRWSMVAATYDGDSLKLYLDARLEAVKAVKGKVMASKAGTLRFGAAGGGQPRFDADLDEMRLMKKALSPLSLFLSHRIVANRKNVHPPTINLAPLSVRIPAGGEGLVPILIANYDTLSVRELRFDVFLRQDFLIDFKGVEKGLGLTKDWAVNHRFRPSTATHGRGNDTVTLTLSCMPGSGPCQPIAPGRETDLVRLRLGFKSGLDWNTGGGYVSLRPVSLNEKSFYGFSIKAGVAVPENRPSSLGDLDGDSVLTTKDALSLLRYLVGALPASDPGLSGLGKGHADVDADSKVNSLDAAHILRAALGFEPILPGDTLTYPEPEQEAGDVELRWEAVLEEGPGKTYRLLAKGITYLIAGEFKLKLPAGATGSNSEAASSMPGVRMAAAFDAQAGLYKLALAWPREFYGSEAELFRMKLPASSDAPPELVSALLNGHAFKGNFRLEGVTALRPSRTPAEKLRLTVRAGALVMPLGQAAGVTVQFFSPDGRALAVKREVRGEALLFKPEGRQGLTLYTVQTGKDLYSGRMMAGK